jgi:hypothetical protein
MAPVAIHHNLFPHAEDDDRAMISTQRGLTAGLWL